MATGPEHQGKPEVPARVEGAAPPHWGEVVETNRWWRVGVPRRKAQWGLQMRARSSLWAKLADPWKRSGGRKLLVLWLPPLTLPWGLVWRS